MSDQLDNLFDSFYSKFVLRDLLAKITPGFILISTIMLNINFNLSVFSNLSFPFWIFLFTISWIVGFAIQGVGEITGLILYRPKTVSEKKWEDTKKRFLALNNEQIKTKYERFVIIKEACGNIYVSLLIGFFYLLFDNVIRNRINEISFDTYMTTISLLIIIVFSLRFMHFEHVKRQYDVMEECVELYCGGEVKHEAVIDRFAENIAIVLFGDEEIKIDIPKKLLPQGAREGSCLKVFFELDPEGTKKQEEKNKRLLEQLKKKPK